MVYRTLDKEVRIIYYMLVAGLVITATCFVYILYIKNNFWLFHIYTLIEYSCIMYALSGWQESPGLRKLLRYSIPVFFLIWLGSKLTVEELVVFDNFTASLSSGLLTFAAGFTLYGSLSDQKQPVFREPRFWIASAVLIYGTGTIVIFSLGISASNSPWIINTIINIITKCLYMGGFLSTRYR